MESKKLEKAIIRTKKLTATMVRLQKIDIVGSIEKLNLEVCLVVADFKCQKCGSEENLVIHHMIMRTAKEFMDLWRYISQRHYWANQIVLCNKCHKEYHRMNGREIGESPLCISNKTINRIKKKYKNV